MQNEVERLCHRDAERLSRWSERCCSAAAPHSQVGPPDGNVHASWPAVKLSDAGSDGVFFRFFFAGGVGENDLTPRRF